VRTHISLSIPSSDLDLVVVLPRDAMAPTSSSTTSSSASTSSKSDAQPLSPHAARAPHAAVVPMRALAAALARRGGVVKLLTLERASVRDVVRVWYIDACAK
jgi:hypothetical protein